MGVERITYISLRYRQNIGANTSTEDTDSGTG